MSLTMGNKQYSSMMIDKEVFDKLKKFRDDNNYRSLGATIDALLEIAEESRLSWELSQTEARLSNIGLVKG